MRRMSFSFLDLWQDAVHRIKTMTQMCLNHTVRLSHISLIILWTRRRRLIFVNRQNLRMYFGALNSMVERQLRDNLHGPSAKQLYTTISARILLCVPCKNQSQCSCSLLLHKMLNSDSHSPFNLVS